MLDVFSPRKRFQRRLEKHVGAAMQRIGVLRRRTQPGEDGKPDDIMDIAAAVHEGATIQVTEKMRLFFAAINHPLKATTTVIVIPSRPFLKTLLSRRAMRFYKKEWERAVQRAISGR